MLAVTANLHSDLGPRSHDPAALFGARLPCFFETRPRLPISATTYRRAGNQTRALGPRRTETSISFLFYRVTPLLSEAVPRGESRFVRPEGPGAGSSRLREFTQPRCRPIAPPPWIAPAVCSEDRRARVEGPSEGRVHECRRRFRRAASVALRFDARCGPTVPLLGYLRTSAVIGAPVCSGGYRCTLTDRPRPSFERRPAKEAAFRKTGMPFTVPLRGSSLQRGGF